MEENVLGKVTYLVSYPENFSADQKYPLVIFLHGAGTRGDNTERLRGNSVFNKLVERQSERGYVVLAPLCNVKNWNEMMPYLIDLVDHFRNLEYIDPKRVHLTGNSMGGYGTFELAFLRASWFASIMPVCGGGIPAFAGKLAEVPVRTFHGICDTVVDPLESLEMVKAINRKGGNAELILFPQLKHNCWNKVYSTEENYDWLLSFTTDREQKQSEEFSGDYYG